MRKKNVFVFGLLICLFLSNYAFYSNFTLSSKINLERNKVDFEAQDSNNISFNPKLAQISGNFSNYNLSVIMDESKSMVEGNLTVDFYNNDNVNFTRIPFHIYLSGMRFITRPGSIVIVNVTDVNNPNISFPFDVYPLSQLIWVNLSETLEPQKRAQFIIQFNATLPDG
ncbi:unnamed protein product, partial [marine sediment metagenome]